MPIANYGLLKASLVASRREDAGASPHFQLHLRAGGTDFRAAVNVKSQTQPSELLFLVDETFDHPLLAALPPLAPGFTPLASSPGGLALDFIRANLFRRAQLRPLPPFAPVSANDLEDRLAHYASRAQAEEGALTYVWGQRWGPEPALPDKVFGFLPGGGVHDVHMNQGNVPPFVQDDGVWQDGALLFFFPATAQWVALFLAFQSQSWHTDDRTGHALSVAAPALAGLASRVRLIAARPGAAPSVTLLNTSPEAVNLVGWQLLNGRRQSLPLAGALPPGAALQVALPGGWAREEGDTLTLLGADGLKVDGAAYTAQDVPGEGWSAVF